MEIRCLTLGVCNTNAYIVREEGNVYLIDPADDAPALMDACKREGWTPTHLLLTHAHFDHILAVNALPVKEVYLHPLDLPLLTDVEDNLSAAWDAPYRVLKPALPLQEGQSIGPFTVLHTPGHRPGSVCFYAKDYKTLFSGDTLFAGGYGRLDLPGGDAAALYASLQRLLSLPEDTLIYPGHGPSTTIGREKGGWEWDV